MRNFLRNKRRRTTNVNAEPKSEPPAAIGKPFMPYAYPQRVTKVVCPTAGGNETTTRHIRLRER